MLHAESGKPQYVSRLLYSSIPIAMKNVNLIYIYLPWPYSFPVHSTSKLGMDNETMLQSITRVGYKNNIAA